MTNYDYQALMHEMARTHEASIVAVCAVCAEKVMPIVRYVALPETTRIAEACLQYSWLAARGEADEAEAQRLLRTVKATPEFAQCDNPDSLPFVVADVLNLSVFALEAVAARSSSEKARWVGFSSVVDTAVAFDLATEAQPACARPKQRIEEAEKQSQLTLIEITRNDDRSAAIERMKAEADRIARLFQEALPTYCYHFVSACLDAVATRTISNARDRL